MDSVRYRFIRLGAVEERPAASVEEALQNAIHDLEISYAAPLAVIEGDRVVFDSKDIRNEYSRRFSFEESKPIWKTRPPNGTRNPRYQQ